MKLGMHRFLVWAPNARHVSVVGDFNGWDASKNRMERLDTGVFAAFVPGLKDGDCYKYQIEGYDGQTVLKADPFAFHAEVRPADRLEGLEPRRLRLARCRISAAALRTKRSLQSHGHIRNAHRLMAQTRGISFCEPA